MKAGSDNWMSVIGAYVFINIHKPATFGGHQCQSSVVDAMRTTVYDGMQHAYDRMQPAYRRMQPASLVGPGLRDATSTDWFRAF